VAARTGNRGVRAHQWEDRCVVESRRSPVTSGVAQSAIGREASRNVSGILCSREIRLVAAVASRGQGCVVAIRVATRAGNGGMSAGQRETRVVVIECRGSPGRRVMACGARRWKARSDVIGVRGPCVIGLMARVAIGGHRCVVVIGVAGCTGNRDMSACERERRSRMIEGSPGPGRRVMARGAGRGKASGNMGRRIGRCKIRLVAAIARGGHRCVIVIGVARRAGYSGMRASQREGRS